MIAGRELDALVAEKIMEWENNWEHPNGRGFPDMWGTMDFDKDGPVRAANFPCYSTEIEDAWEVVERMARCHPDILRRTLPDRVMVRMQVWADRLEEVDATADTAPLAICLAALKAVSFGVEVPA